MGLFDWWKASGRRAQQRGGTGFELSRQLYSPPRKGTPEILAAYKTMPRLRTVVGKVGDGVAKVNWRLYRPAPEKREEAKRLKFADLAMRRSKVHEMADAKQLAEVFDHPLIKVLEDPSDHITGYALWKLHQVYQDLVGDTFLVLELRGKVPVGLWPVPPTWVQRLPDYTQPPEKRVYTIRAGLGTIYEIPASMVIHLRDVDPEDPIGRGSGIAFSLGDELDTDEYAAQFSRRMLFNNAIPGAIIGVKGMPTGDREMAKAFKESLYSEYGGPENANRVMVTPAESVSLAKLDSKLVDLQFVEQREFLGDFIRMSYGVPPEIIGDMSSSNKASAYAAREIFAEQVIEPRMEFLRRELQKRLVPLYGDDLILEFDSPVPEDREFRLKVMTAFREGYKINDARALSGHRPDEKRGDEYLKPAPGATTNSQSNPDAPEGSAQEAAEESKKPAA